MIESIPSESPDILAFRLSGKLSDADYQIFVPAVEQALAAVGKPISLLAKFDDFHGWDLHAAWDDLKFGVRHYSDLDRIALVGDTRREKRMARLARPFTKASVRYFDANTEEAAWLWLRTGI